MFHWFGAEHCATLFVDAGEHSCVRQAAVDLAHDVLAVSGKVMPLRPYLPVEGSGVVVVGSLENPAFRQWVQPYVDGKTLAKEWEGFRIVANERFLLVAGSDRRGAMWGVYALSRHALGVDPCYRFTGSHPAKRESLSLEEGITAGGPRTFRFRGWFLNDEDLLSDWRDGGGARHIDYPFYAQVTHPDVLAMVLETAVRLGINLIIPASFVDIRNPPEENLIRMAVERGLYVSQHHVEPLGVSHFGFENYWRARGREEAFSFVTNREKVVECWRASVRKWAKYEGVIWQLGLRGRGDRPAWYNDKAIDDSDQAHGAIISEALQTQYNLIREELGQDDFFSTATLWMEGTELCFKGLLRFPETTTVVFADAGETQLFGRDFFELPREPKRRYGLYYHVAFWGAGPHLLQGTDLRKMQYQYRLALEKGDTEYTILNVSNVREFIMSARAYAELAWDADAFDETAYLDGYFREMFGLENGAERMHAHFDAFAAKPVAEGDDYQRFWKAQAILPQTDFQQNVILDGVARGMGLQALRAMQQDNSTSELPYGEAHLRSLETGIRAFEANYVRLNRDFAHVREGGKEFFRDALLVQEEIVLGLYRWARSCLLAYRAWKSGEGETALNQLRHAEFCLSKLLEDRKKAEHGAFMGWYRGDTKMNLPGALEETRRTMAQIQGR